MAVDFDLANATASTDAHREELPIARISSGSRLPFATRSLPIWTMDTFDMF